MGFIIDHNFFSTGTYHYIHQCLGFTLVRPSWIRQFHKTKSLAEPSFLHRIWPHSSSCCQQPMASAPPQMLTMSAFYLIQLHNSTQRKPKSTLSVLPLLLKTHVRDWPTGSFHKPCICVLFLRRHIQPAFTSHICWACNREIHNKETEQAFVILFQFFFCSYHRHKPVVSVWF